MQVVSAIDGIIEANKRTVDEFEKSFTETEKQQAQKDNESGDKDSQEKTWEGSSSSNMSEEEVD